MDQATKVVREALELLHQLPEHLYRVVAVVVEVSTTRVLEVLHLTVVALEKVLVEVVLELVRLIRAAVVAVEKVLVLEEMAVLVW
jgi:hypothetical protein